MHELNIKESSFHENWDSSVDFLQGPSSHLGVNDS